MTITLPKKFLYVGGDYKVASENETLILSPVKKGVLLYNGKGNLSGQVFTDKKGATIAVPDGCAYRIELSDNSVKITVSSESQRAPFSRYEIFGKVASYAYTLYEYLKNSLRPVIAAEVTPSPFDDKYYKVYLNEERNVYRNILIVAALSLLTEK